MYSVLTSPSRVWIIKLKKTYCTIYPPLMEKIAKSITCIFQSQHPFLPFDFIVIYSFRMVIKFFPKRD